MKETANIALLRPSGSQREAKADTTTKAARHIIDGEMAARAAKTERLRAARLAQEAISTPTPVKRARGQKR